jgi:hypothetical protein
MGGCSNASEAVVARFGFDAKRRALVAKSVNELARIAGATALIVVEEAMTVKYVLRDRWRKALSRAAM